MPRAQYDLLAPSIALARSVELTLGETAAVFARARKRLAPDEDARAARIGDGLAVTSGASAGRNSSRTFALGTAALVTEPVIEQVEDFYRGQRPAAVVASPLAHASLFTALEARSFRIASFNAVLIGEPTHRPRAKRIEVVALAPSDLDVVVQVVRGALGDAEAERVRLTALPLLEEPSCMYVARVGGEPAGIGSVARVGDAALLLAGMTAAAFRSRGVQRALIDARIEAAAKSGARFVLSVAEPGSTSERNLLRAGLRSLYTSVVFEKPERVGDLQ